MAGRNMMLRDDSGDYAEIDDTISALRTIDCAHSEIHEGESYSLAFTAAKNAAETYEVRIQTPNSMKELHMLFRASGVLGTTLAVYEATSKAHVGGNALTPLNRNRNAKGTSGATACHTPSGSGDGTLILQESFGGSRNAGGGSARSDSEFILKRNTAYLFRLTSNENSNTVNGAITWYEERTATYTTTTTSTTTSTTSTTSTTTSTTSTTSTTTTAP